MSMNEGSPEPPKKKSKSELTAAYCYAYALVRELDNTGKIDKASFSELWKNKVPGVKADPIIASCNEPDDVDWNRAFHSVRGVLSFMGIPHNGSPDGISLATRIPRNYSAQAFKTTEDPDFEAKARIGDLVAKFLRNGAVCNLEESVFLGSGTSIFHVGLAMCRQSQQYGAYPQLFATINIALASLWCTQETPPTGKLSIPRCVLEASTFRFETLQADEDEQRGWTPAMVIVGADGCYYDKSAKKIRLYGKSNSVADNTNLYVRSAKTTVIYCLSSRKMGGRNDGPRLRMPENGIVRAIVTEKENIPPEIHKAFTDEKFEIIARDADFEKIRKRRHAIDAAEKLPSSKSAPPSS